MQNLLKLTITSIAFVFSGLANAVVITLPAGAQGVLDIAGSPWSAAWVHSFFGVGAGLPEEGGGNICNQLAADECAVNGSLAIQKQNIGGSTEPGPLFDAAQTFTVDFGPDPFGNGNSDGTWTYNTAPPFVTAWVTQGGSDGYTVFYLVPDGTLAPGAVYMGFTVPTGLALPFGTFDLDNTGALSIADLSNITWFDSDTPVPPTEIAEPGTLLLVGAALALLALVGWRNG